MLVEPRGCKVGLGEHAMDFKVGDWSNGSISSLWLMQTAVDMPKERGWASGKADYHPTRPLLGTNS